VLGVQQMVVNYQLDDGMSVGFCARVSPGMGLNHEVNCVILCQTLRLLSKDGLELAKVFSGELCGVLVSAEAIF
jgi:hypothetical protein